jgi:hypothetical protein
VRVTTLCKRLLDLDGISVTKVGFAGGVLVADVALRRRLLACPRCEFTTRARYDIRPVKSLWRGLDLGRRKVSVRAVLRRLQCPTHGVVTEGVPFARAGARFTRDFEGNCSGPSRRGSLILVWGAGGFTCPYCDFPRRQVLSWSIRRARRFLTLRRWSSCWCCSRSGTWR